MLAADYVRDLFEAIDTRTLLGARDQALLALMVYTFARVSAATGMRRKDYFVEGRERVVRLLEKGSKRREIPAHRALVRHLNLYLKKAAEFDEEARALGGNPRLANDQDWLFQTIRGGKLTGRRMAQADAYRMVRRRALAAGVLGNIGNHSWRATGITTYLNQGGSLEHAQDIAGHVSPKTTRLYERREDKEMREEIERIQF